MGSSPHVREPHGLATLHAHPWNMSSVGAHRCVPVEPIVSHVHARTSPGSQNGASLPHPSAARITRPMSVRMERETADGLWLFDRPSQFEFACQSSRTMLTAVYRSYRYQIAP